MNLHTSEINPNIDQDHMNKNDIINASQIRSKDGRENSNNGDGDDCSPILRPGLTSAEADINVMWGLMPETSRNTSASIPASPESSGDSDDDEHQKDRHPQENPSKRLKTQRDLPIEAVAVFKSWILAEKNFSHPVSACVVFHSYVYASAIIPHVYFLLIIFSMLIFLPV